MKRHDTVAVKVSSCMHTTPATHRDHHLPQRRLPHGHPSSLPRPNTHPCWPYSVPEWVRRNRQTSTCHLAVRDPSVSLVLQVLPETDLCPVDAVDPTQELLFLDPPEPAPGAPLLSDSDTKLLSSFFEDMTSDHFATTSFGEGLNFSEDWLNLPPQFMGTATSFGQQPAVAIESPGHTLQNHNYHSIMHPHSSLMPPPPPPPVAHMPLEQQHPSADVLEAATLLQNGSLSRSNSTSHDTIFPARDMAGALASPLAQMRHPSLSERRISQPAVPNDHDHTFTEMMFGTGGSQVQTRSVQTPVDVRWGSDANFTKGQSFIPPSEKETREALEEEQLRYMGCLEVSKSAASTRPSSPLFHADASPLKLKTRVPVEPIKTEDEADMPARKRRKSKAKEDAEDNEDGPAYATSKTAARKRKSKVGALSITPPTASDASGKRRKSTANGAGKQSRENLTEEQKRENHIKSEQKRRTLIKEGFDDLCDLVPGLKGGGFSKSTMLTMAAEWLEELLKGNDQLKAQLAELEGR